MLMASGFCCCDGILAIVIYNSNAAIDDDFEVFLNGTSIGAISNNANDVTGRIFAADTAITPANIGTPAANVFETTLSLDTGLLVVGTNTIRVQSTVDRHNGNLGIIRIGRYRLGELTPGKYDLHGTAILESIYDHLSGVGQFTERTFTY